MSDSELLIVDTDTAETVGRAELDDRDVVFPEGIDGWTAVLDARHPPYADRTLEENCEYAAHVRKPYLLVCDTDLDATAD